MSIIVRMQIPCGRVSAGVAGAEREAAGRRTPQAEGWVWTREYLCEP